MSANVLDLAAARGRTTRLEDVGWRSKERLGKRIYQHPASGCWYSEAAALELVRRGEEGEGC